MSSLGFGLVRASSLAPFVRYLEERGGVPQRHLDAGGVSGELTDDSDAWVGKVQAYRVLESAARREAGEDIGLAAGSSIGVSDLGPIGEAVIRAPTLKDACETFGALLPQYAHGNSAGVQRVGTEAWFAYRTLDHRKGNRDYADHYGLMILLAVVRQAAGPDWAPRSVRLQTGKTEAFSRLEPWKDTEVAFDQRSTGFAFPAGWLQRPAAVDRPPVATRNHVASASGTLSAPLEALLAAYLPVGGAPTIEMTADVVGMSPRTLKRRLAEEGLTYTRLLDRLRYRAAVHLLGDPGLSVKEIAYALGYSGPNNFVRAFRRVAGCTPGEWRRRGAAISER
jgi:AraC-like DNA-binding protein